MKKSRTVTVGDLIDDVEACFRLDAVMITINHCGHIYERDEIDCIDEEVYEATIQNYRIEDSKRRGGKCIVIEDNIDTAN